MIMASVLWRMDCLDDRLAERFQVDLNHDTDHGRRSDTGRTDRCSSSAFAAPPTRRFRRSDPERDHDLVSRTVPRVPLPGQVLVIAPNGSFKALALRIAALNGTEIYRKGPPE